MALEALGDDRGPAAGLRVWRIRRFLLLSKTLLLLYEVGSLDHFSPARRSSDDVAALVRDEYRGESRDQESSSLSI